MCPRMQKFSAEIPWVLVHTYPDGSFGGYAFNCDVCGDRNVGNLPALQSFAAAHRVHQAPRGSMRLGDAFAAVAKPVARAVGIDPNCTPCEARRRAMNALRFR
jgi:hypothetical protein